MTHVVTKSDSGHSVCLDNFSCRDLENIQHAGIRGVPPNIKGQWENQTESSVTFFLCIFHLEAEVGQKIILFYWTVTGRSKIKINVSPGHDVKI